MDYRFTFPLWKCIDVKKVIKKAIKKLEKIPQADPVFAAFQKRLQLLVDSLPSFKAVHPPCIEMGETLLKNEDRRTHAD